MESNILLKFFFQYFSFWYCDKINNMLNIVLAKCQLRNSFKQFSFSPIRSVSDDSLKFETKGSLQEEESK